MIGSFKIAALFRALALFSAIWAPSVLAADQKFPLIEWLDPMKEGFGTSLSISDHPGDLFYRSGELSLQYGFGQGFSASVSVPAVLFDTSTTLQSPRIGGSALSRIEADGLFRVWGDSYDYVILKLGVALPLQSDPLLQRSGLASWVIPFELDWRTDWKWIALAGRIASSPELPSNILLKNDIIHFDTSNSVSAELDLIFFDRARVSPSIHLTELFPQVQDAGIEVGANSFILSEVSTARSRFLGISVDTAPISASAVLSVEVDRDLLAPDNGRSLLYLTGRIRWLF